MTLNITIKWQPSKSKCTLISVLKYTKIRLKIKILIYKYNSPWINNFKNKVKIIISKKIRLINYSMRTANLDKMHNNFSKSIIMNNICCFLWRRFKSMKIKLNCIIIIRLNLILNWSLGGNKIRKDLGKIK